MSRVLVFDSGVGGLSVHRAIDAAMPAIDLLYLADDAGFPYGEMDENTLKARVVDIVSEAIATHEPDAVVIACNTASTLVLDDLRTRFACPFVGTVPAIKPAAAASRTGLISVLATPATVRRDYTKDLIEAHAGACAVTLVGAPRLAGLAEAYLREEPVADDDLGVEVAPCFVRAASARTDHVVLACTHFPLLIDRLTGIAPWPVTWIDPSPAIARRVRDVLNEPETGGRVREFRTTSGKPWPHTTFRGASPD
ncbi:MAG: glutamate racemase [Pseudomonadota bacterium]